MTSVLFCIFSLCEKRFATINLRQSQSDFQVLGHLNSITFIHNVNVISMSIDIVFKESTADYVLI